jgi:AcrR family transcriptional regulator
MAKNNHSSSAAGPLRAKAGINTRQEILDAAAIVFSQNGYEASSLKEIADRVGIKTPSIYAHFRSKNELLFTVVNEALCNLRDACEVAVKNAPEVPSEQLVAFVKAHIMEELKYCDVMSMLDSYIFRAYSLPSGLKEQQKQDILEAQRQLVNILREILKAGHTAGSMSFKNVSVATFAILGICEHIAYWYRPGGSLSADEITNELAKLAFNMVKAPPK